MSRTREGWRRTEAEIAREKAAALGRAGERLEGALADVELAARRLSGASDPRTRERRAREYATALSRAREARLALLIQREALGLHHHAVVDQAFPEPSSDRP